MSEDTRDTKPTWPYTSFKTINNLMQRFEAERDIPPRLDRSILGGSEGQKTQVLAAMKFLGLVQGANNEVTPLLRQLVEHPKDRQRIISGLLGTHYPEASKLGTLNATAKQLEETFVGLNGDTLRKAVAFYLNAAKFANHPISKHFKAPRGTKRASRRQNGGTPATAGNGGDENPPAKNTPQPSSLAALRVKYIEGLMEKLNTSDQLDSELADRIERLLQIDSAEE